MALLRGLKSGMERSALEGLQYPGTTPDPDFTGTLPTTLGKLGGWTGTACWTVGFNFQDATGASVSCASMSDGAAMTVSKLTNNPTILSAPQAGWASQGGISIAAANELLFTTDADWDVNATIPTIYTATISMDAGPSSAQQVLTGLTGVGAQGWMIEADGASGLRITCMGSSSSYVSGSSAMFDGEPHVIAWVVDDANGKAKLFTEWGTAELTGLTYTQTGSLICTVGPSSTGASWTATTKYFQMARGQHALAYTNAATVVSTYNTALTTGVEPDAILGLPTTLAQLTDAAGYTFTEGYNLSSLTPASIGTGSALAAYTGVMQGGANGTAPTLNATGQIRTSFTAQRSIGIDSAVDNLQGASAMPNGAFTAVLVIKPPSGGHPGSQRYILGRLDNVAGESGWYIDTSNQSNYRFVAYNSYSADTRTATATITTVAADNAWHVIVVRRAAPSGVNRIKVDGATTATATANSATGFTSVAAQGGLGKLYECDLANTPFTCSMAFFGWANTACSDAQVETISEGFRWRYGL